MEISIYDISGALVRRLHPGHRQAGYYVDRGHAGYWDGRNDWGERVSSGLYFYRIDAGDFTAVRRMVISK